jgi:hypothetical protein
MIKESCQRAVFYELLACGLLGGSTVDVAPSIAAAVTSASVGVTDDSLMIHLYFLILLMIYL